MQVVHLDAVDKKSYKARKLSDSELKPSELLGSPEKFVLATKMCDGSFHRVHSDASKILEKNRELIAKGHINEPFKMLSPPDESVHGQRFLIFDSEPESYLLGDVATALKKLSGK